jgi:hypothetical protein
LKQGLIPREKHKDFSALRGGKDDIHDKSIDKYFMYCCRNIIERNG